MSAATDQLYRDLSGVAGNLNVKITAPDWSVDIPAGDLHAAMRPVMEPARFAPVYISQWYPEANARQNDCGPTAVAMHLRARGSSVTVNELRTSDPTGLTTADQLQTMFFSYGIPATVEQLSATDDLASIVKPYSLLLINYSPLRYYAQDKGFTGWHWLVYIGPDPDDASTSIVMDPDYWGNRIAEGDHKRYPTSALRAAFRPYGNGKTAQAIYVPDLPISVPPFEAHDVTTTAPLNVRTGPGTTYAIRRTLVKGAKVTVVQQNGGWLKLDSPTADWISAAYTVPVR